MGGGFWTFHFIVHNVANLDVVLGHLLRSSAKTFQDAGTKKQRRKIIKWVRARKSGKDKEQKSWRLVRKKTKKRQKKYWIWLRGKARKTEHRRETSFENNTSTNIFRHLSGRFPMTWLYNEKQCQKKHEMSANLPAMTSRGRYCSTALLATSQQDCTNCGIWSTGKIRPGEEWSSLQSNVIQHFFCTSYFNCVHFFL